jgi:LacI family transcriptional regulator
VDNAGGINMLIDHLAGFGHRRFGFISGGFSGGRLIGDIAERRSAFVERLARERLFIQSSWLREGANTMAGGAAAFDALMSEADRPTAVICSTDLMAIGALHAAYRAGLAVPDEISIVGFDDLPLASYTNPALTTIHNPTAEMAEVGVRAAIEGTNQGKDGWLRVLAPSIVVRASSGRPRAF